MPPTNSLVLLKNQRGSALIETAIVLPIFIFVLIAIFDFGMYFNARNVAQSAAWNGAKACSSGASPNDIIKTTLGCANIDITDEDITAECPVAGKSYNKVTVTIAGSTTTTFFTSMVNLYPMTTVGIAN